MLTAVVGIALSCLGCRDDITSARLSPPSGGARLSISYRCSVDVVAQRTSCRRQVNHAQRGTAVRTINPPVEVEALFANEAYYAATSQYRADVRIVNRTANALGTPDGTAVTGVKVFFEADPVVTAYRTPGNSNQASARGALQAQGNPGAVLVRNPTGHQTFTKAAQPYFFYPEIIQTGKYSQAKEWQWTVPANVRSFEFTVRVFTATEGATYVPVEAPNSVPASIYAAPNQVTSSGWMTGPFLRNIVVVGFHGGVTQEERQSAVDVVGGELVGGRNYQIGEGEYFIRIPDDGTEATLRQAIDTLNTLPQVEFAVVEFVDAFDGSYRVPADGPHYQPTSWTTDADSAFGTNWNLEAISAPFAWGCEIGSDSARVPIGVVDQHLRVVPDLAPNVTRQFGVGVVPGEGHGTAVAAVIGARGNNQLQMTGVLWSADLRLYESGVDAAGQAVVNGAGVPRYTLDNLLDRITMAAREGAVVVNLSMGRTWNHTPGSQSGDSASILQDYARVRRVVRQLDSLRIMPVLVVAAGNQAANPYYNLFPLLRRDFPARVIVVAAARRTGPNQYALHPTSNRGALIDLAAPGDSIASLDNADRLRYFGQTSYAAPHVTGVAGLIRSFDSRISLDSIKQLITAGADSSGRSAGGFRMLNAHWSLRLAARRAGAPLCGSRVWIENRQVRSRRLVSGTERVDSLFGTDLNPDGLQAFHGGKELLFHDDLGYHYRTWERTGRWVERPVPDSLWDVVYDGAGPTHRSLLGLSHDRDSYVYSSAGSGVLNLQIETLATGSTRSLGAFPRAGSSTTTACVFEIRSPTAPTECRDSVYVGAVTSSSSSLAAYGPRGDRVYVAVNRYQSSTQISGDWYLCPGQPEYHQIYYCRNTVESKGTAGATLYGVPTNATSASQWVAVAQTSTGNFRDIAVGDGADEFVVQEESSSGGTVSKWEKRNWAIIEGTLSWTRKAEGSMSRNCATQFRNLGSGSVVYTRPGCGWSELTLAPIRLPNGRRVDTTSPPAPVKHRSLRLASPRQQRQ